MSSNWGKKITLSIFGESHGQAVGINIGGLPRGFALDMAKIDTEMSRRAPGTALSTSRREEDRVQIISGIQGNLLTGAPLCAVIKNENRHSKDYSVLKEVMRPGHSDYPAYIKYKGFNDVRGGGVFSGRLTAPLVFAGRIAKQILAERGVVIGAHLKNVGPVKDAPFPCDITGEQLKKLFSMPLPFIDSEKIPFAEEIIRRARAEGNSTGGCVECAAINLPAGLGDPFFDSVESTLSHLLFSIPGVKGVEFGDGFALSEMKGSEARDEYYFDGRGNVQTHTNHNGGILGGLTTGMPLVFSVALKPTSSISLPQNTINVKTGENTVLSLTGRHDPCIAVRAVPVVEAACALALLETGDFLNLQGGEAER